MSEGECCVNCAYFLRKRRRWKTTYCCTKDGTDRQLGMFDNYTGKATNVAIIELRQRCCMDFKQRGDCQNGK